MHKKRETGMVLQSLHPHRHSQRHSGCSRHCPILLVSKRKISNTVRDYNTNIIALANGHYITQFNKFAIIVAEEYNVYN